MIFDYFCVNFTLNRDKIRAATWVAQALTWNKQWSVSSVTKQTAHRGVGTSFHLYRFYIFGRMSCNIWKLNSGNWPCGEIVCSCHTLFDLLFVNHSFPVRLYVWCLLILFYNYILSEPCVHCQCNLIQRKNQSIINEAVIH